MDGSPPYEFRTRTRGYVLTTETIATDRLDPADLASLVTALQSRGLRVEVPIGERARRRRPRRRRDALHRGRADHRADQRRLRRGLAVRPARRGRRQLGHLSRAPNGWRSPPSHPRPRLLRPDHRRRHPVLADRADAPGLGGQHRPADLRLLGQRRPVHVLRHRGHARQRPHDREEDTRRCSPRSRSPPATSTARSTRR